MKCYEEFVTPNIEKFDEYSKAEFLCKQREVHFHIYIRDDRKVSAEDELKFCAGAMKAALSVCHKCPLFQQKIDS